MCEHLKRERVLIRSNNFDAPMYYGTEFTCAVTGSRLYSAKLERRHHCHQPFKPIPEVHGDRMPLACDFYKAGTTNTDDLEFNTESDG